VTEWRGLKKGRLSSLDADVQIFDVVLRFETTARQMRLVSKTEAKFFTDP